MINCLRISCVQFAREIKSCSAALYIKRECLLAGILLRTFDIGRKKVVLREVRAINPYCSPNSRISLGIFAQIPSSLNEFNSITKWSRVMIGFSTCTLACLKFNRAYHRNNVCSERIRISSGNVPFVITKRGSFVKQASMSSLFTEPSRSSTTSCTPNATG